MDYNTKLHNKGRIWMAGAILMMAMIPIAATIIFKTGPEWKALGIAFGILTLMNLPVAIGEVFIYSYMLGTNGTYLAFVTGNLSNLKIPCVINAVNIVGTEVGTEENEIASTISIAVSAITTTVVIGIGVMLLALTPASQVFESKYLQPAFGVVAYALFGALGGQYLLKYPKIAIIPFVVMTALAILLVAVGLGGTVVKPSYFVFVGVILCVLNGFRLYGKKKGQDQIDAETADVAGTLSADGSALNSAAEKIKSTKSLGGPEGWVLKDDDTSKG